MMKKRALLLAVLLSGVLVAPVHAEEPTHADKSQSAGKHNFDTWQTLKRLQAVR
ncbi:MAG: hypothetical protein WCC10_10365 [Tumebacillaceae bacterium]